jgi:DUF1365 family protein
MQQLTVHMGLYPTGEAQAAPALFDAALSLRRVPISRGSLATILLRFPLMTMRVMAAIHWQALRLWLKRVPVHSHPAVRAGGVSNEAGRAGA